MTEAIIIYVTCVSQAEAEMIASELLEHDLIACANIMPPHKALYKWDGKVESGAETGVLLKTTAALFKKAEIMICHLHSYDTPCVVAWPVSQGHEPFLRWIETAVKSGN